MGPKTSGSSLILPRIESTNLPQVESHLSISRCALSVGYVLHIGYHTDVLPELNFFYVGDEEVLRYLFFFLNIKIIDFGVPFISYADTIT